MLGEAHGYPPHLSIPSSLTPTPFGTQLPFSSLLNKAATGTAISTPQQLLTAALALPGKTTGWPGEHRETDKKRETRGSAASENMVVGGRGGQEQEGCRQLLVLHRRGRKLLPRVVSPTTAAWQLLTWGLNPRCTICRYPQAEIVPGSHSKAVAHCSSAAFASPRKTSINCRNGPSPCLQGLLNATSWFWKYAEA